jgi:hypothetical protein
MSDTSTEVLILTALAGGAGGFAGAALSAWLTVRSRSTDRRREQQRRDAEVIGPVYSLISDAHPDRLAFNLSRDVDVQRERMEALRLRGNTAVGGLYVMAAGHPDGNVRSVSRDLAVDVQNALTSAGWFIHDMTQDRDQGYRDTAMGDHQKARDLLEQLTTLVASSKP